MPLVEIRGEVRSSDTVAHLRTAVGVADPAVKSADGAARQEDLSATGITALGIDNGSSRRAEDPSGDEPGLGQRPEQQIAVEGGCRPPLEIRVRSPSRCSIDTCECVARSGSSRGVPKIEKAGLISGAPRQSWMASAARGDQALT